MFEKVSPAHPDKLCDRLAGAIVDVAYSRVENPKIAVEVLAGHQKVYVMIETSLTQEQLSGDDIDPLIHRIFGEEVEGEVTIVPQDVHLADNQQGGVRCGDNGIFKGCAPTHEQRLLTAIATSIYDKYPTDGKYIIRGAGKLVKPWFSVTVCQSHMPTEDNEALAAHLKVNYGIAETTINPLGEWTGGINTDCGAVNRKLGSDMGDGVSGGGLHGKDLSKGDVSINIVCFLKAVQSGQTVTACCSIGDEQVTFQYADGKRETETFADIVEMARLYILTDCNGSFETFSEWGLIRPKTE